MQITMDRYEANWPMVEQGWRTHVHGDRPTVRLRQGRPSRPTAQRPAASIRICPLSSLRENGEPVAKIANGDSVILFNFRGDRAQEISLAFDRKDFDHFDRGDYTGVKFAGMLQYDGDLKIPPALSGAAAPSSSNTLTEVLCAARHP